MITVRIIGFSPPVGIFHARKVKNNQHMTFGGQEKMIKGVNRQVIEITQTKCEYFEKCAVFRQTRIRRNERGYAARAGRSDSRQRGYSSGKQTQKEKNYLRAEIRLLRARGSRSDGDNIISALNNSCKICSSRRRDNSVCVRCTPPCREARSGGRNRCSF